MPSNKNVVAGTDGAGEVVDVGSRVIDFKKGDRVATTFYQDHAWGQLTPRAAATALGTLKDGAFREYAVMPQSGLVHVPKNLSWEEASTLGCAAVTAWNALYGSRKVVAGDTILVQGTGGVSLFALQVSLIDHCQLFLCNSSEGTNNISILVCESCRGYCDCYNFVG